MNAIAFLILLWTVAFIAYTIFAVKDMLHYVENDMAEEGLETLNEPIDEKEE